MSEETKTVSTKKRAGVPTHAKVCKLDKERRLVFGFAVVCKDAELGGKDAEYTDLQKQYVPEEVMLDAAFDFFRGARVAKAMHGKDPETADERGDVVFGFPLTTEIAKAIGVETQTTGLLVGMRTSEEVFKRFESGDYTMFSIGGEGEVVEEEIED